MRRALLLAALATAALCPRTVSAAPEEILLPEFPAPPLILEGGTAKQIGSIRLLRELHRSGVRGLDLIDTLDGEYALFRGDSLGKLSAWLETACQALDFNITRARANHYDGTVFARLLNLATSLASLREDTIGLAMPVGVLLCRRDLAWGELPADHRDDAYILFVTDLGMLVYDPPTRQLARLADFPNKSTIVKIWF